MGSKIWRTLPCFGWLCWWLLLKENQFLSPHQSSTQSVHSTVTAMSCISSQVEKWWAFRTILSGALSHQLCILKGYDRHDRWGFGMMPIDPSGSSQRFFSDGKKHNIFNWYIMAKMVMANKSLTSIFYINDNVEKSEFGTDFTLYSIMFYCFQLLYVDCFFKHSTQEYIEYMRIKNVKKSMKVERYHV